MYELVLIALGLAPVEISVLRYAGPGRRRKDVVLAGAGLEHHHWL